MTQKKHIFANTDRWERLLPPLKGIVKFNEPLSKRNWFGTGGVAEVFIEPADANDLSLLLQSLLDVPFTLLGGGSNVLIRDGGIPGITVHLGKEFSSMSLSDNIITCGAGALKTDVARFALKNALSGFEFLACIPGTIGGGIRMNAGCYGQQMADVLVSLTAMTPTGEIKIIDSAENPFLQYRKCLLPDNWIFLSAIFQGTPADPQAIQQRITENKTKKEATQPLGVRTAGSTFKNPKDVPAWKLITDVGMKGANIGDAYVSDKHANFLINKGTATSTQLEQLGETIRQKVLQNANIDLEWEVKRIGLPLSEDT